nr:ATP-dependent DNA helicase RecQ [uncultured Prevotella sp.]
MDKFQEILHTYWGYSDFRGIQRDIIESIANGRDTLGLMPTGGGKSITFQVPALAKEGVCIVITPLIALMKDQVQHLKERGIQAAAIHADMSRSEVVQTLENCIFGGIKILYISPERLASEIFQVKLRHINVSFITVDEAHCISQWGYDFRPSYLNIANIRTMKPGTPILALTATATPDVVNDIQEKLHFEKKNVFKMSFERKNLAYIVRTVGDKDYEMIHILRCVGGAAIVYCRSRKHTKEIAALLNKNGIKSTFYHAGLLPTVKDERQRAWQNDEIRVIVATNAFGMGIDKPDVRMVIHIDCPDSLEAYFQEAGRAGRDGNKAYAVLLYDPSDERKLKKRIDDTFPPKDFIRNVYEHLAYFFQVGIASGRGKTFEFNIDKFSYIYKFFPIRVDAALRILERCGYIHYEDNPDGKARLMFCLNRNELYLLDNLSPKEDAIVTALLRTYGGLFTDYVYIDESLIAYQADTSIEQVYVTLKNFSARHIVQFIPRRKTPYITYAKDRIDGEKVIIPNEVWEQRREQYAHRIEGILRYAKEDYICRSRQLLAYFGEATQEDCHQCDVCLEQYTDNTTKDKYFKEAQQAIRLLLGDHKPHFITELRDILLPSQYVDEALEFLVGENQIHIDGSYISLYE